MGSQDAIQYPMPQTPLYMPMTRHTKGGFIGPMHTTIKISQDIELPRLSNKVYK